MDLPKCRICGLRHRLGSCKGDGDSVKPQGVKMPASAVAAVMVAPGPPAAKRVPAPPKVSKLPTTALAASREIARNGLDVPATVPFVDVARVDTAEFREAVGYHIKSQSTLLSEQVPADVAHREIRAVYETGGVPSLTSLIQAALAGTDLQVTFRSKAKHQAASRASMQRARSKSSSQAAG